MGEQPAHAAPPAQDGLRVQPVGLVADLLSALDDAEIAYCHWKSNEAIDRSLTADNDLDLLVARRHSTSFNAAVHAVGFRIARPAPDRLVPGLVDYFGRDPDTGRMVHVQAHFQLVLGDDMTKNFRLPLEEAYLASRVPDGPIAVANRAFELLVFIVRMVVKHCPWDAQLSRQGRLTASERNELAFLVERSSPAELEALRAQHMPFLSADLLAGCRAALGATAGRVERARVGRRLLKVLEPYGRRPRRSDLRLRLWRRLWRSRQAGAGSSRRSLDTGGLLVAVVGGDGSGKSSAVAAATATFSRRVPARAVHMGKPPRSVLTRVVGGSMRRLGVARRTRRLPAWTDWERVGFPGHGFVLLHLLVARDRRRTYRAARRAADQGSLVVCDRFPLRGIELMDGPRTGALPGLERRPVARWLSQLEARCYRAIDLPDLLVVLRVEPELAVARRPEQDADFVRRRAAEVWSHDWTSTRAVVIDASQSHEAVLDEVHLAIWGAL